MQITNVYVSFNGIKKGKRTSKFQIVKVAQIEGHVKLSDETKPIYFEKAKSLIKEQGYRVNGFNLKLNVNFGELRDNIEMIALYPVQSIEFSKEL